MHGMVFDDLPFICLLLYFSYLKTSPLKRSYVFKFFKINPLNLPMIVGMNIRIFLD